jgi:hypothetical protein
MAFVCATCELAKDEVICQGPEPPRPPQIGDFWLCPRCGQVHRFAPLVSRGRMELFARRCDDKELLELQEPDRSLLLKERASIQARFPEVR